METKLGSKSEFLGEPNVSNSSTSSNRLLSSSLHLSGAPMQISTANTANLRLLQHSQTICTPSMKAMIPLTMDEHSSSTESAQDQQERELTINKCPETPKRSKPSKIPLKVPYSLFYKVL